MGDEAREPEPAAVLSRPFAEDYEILRHAEKQGVSWSDAWRYFEREGYNMDGATGQYAEGLSADEIAAGTSWMQRPPGAPIEHKPTPWSAAADEALGLDSKDIREPLIGYDFGAKGLPITFYRADEQGRIAPVRIPQPPEVVRVIVGKPTGATDPETGLRAYQAGDHVTISDPIPVRNHLGPSPEMRRFLETRMNDWGWLYTPIFEAMAQSALYSPGGWIPPRRLVVDPAWSIEDTHPFVD